MIRALTWTLLSEGLLLLLLARLIKKPLLPLLLTSLAVNLLTQLALWTSLNLFYRYSQPTLLVMEMLIWPFEGLVYWKLPANRLSLPAALALSLLLNATSFALGWVVPA